jgi:uncharacterized membrane protein YuzA (DUF378 family)
VGHAAPPAIFGAGSMLARIVYILVGASAAWQAARLVARKN